MMHNGFKGLCQDFLDSHPKHFISQLRVNGSAIESLFSAIKYQSGGNLTSVNYPTSLSALITQKEIRTNPHSEKGYRADIVKIN